MNFPLSEPAAARLLDVLIAAQRLTKLAGCFTATYLGGAVGNGWTLAETDDVLDHLAAKGFLRRVAVPDGPDVYFPTPRLSLEEHC